MKGLIAKATLSGLLIGFPLSEGHAACEESHRVSDADAQCMTLETWSTGGESLTPRPRPWKEEAPLTKPMQHYVKVKNECPEWGKVVVKVDLENQTDVTWELTDGNWREYAWTEPKRVKSVACCSDLSDLCSKTDVVTVRGCRAQYNESSALDTCQQANVRVSGESCVVTARCESAYHRGRFWSSTVIVDYPETKDLSNCNGTLTVGSC